MNLFLDKLRIVDKHTLNKLVLTFAGRNSLPLAVIYHTGRRSHKAYKTPILVEPLGRALVVTLTYGPETDWYRNALAAGGCTILWHRKKHRITRLEVIPADTAMQAFPLFARVLLRAFRRTQFVRMS